ncbi:hypothetical protein ACF1A5_25785 [Streptomyces sp. NPDC014864]|uniref:hypothetical protein n=1 Tax=Streptomyces sp. NPDC014864 TaxID=3364924 RepID=UPI003702BBAB
MASTTGRWGEASNGAVRCVWGAVVALLAAFAVLVHHDAAGPMAVPGAPAVVSAMPGTSAVRDMSAVHGMDAMPGMGHASPATGTRTTTVTGATKALGAADLPAGSGDNTCSSAATGHCSAASLGSVRFVSPPAEPRAGPADAVHGVRAAHSSLGVAHCAPPDLSLLSRLLI